MDVLWFRFCLHLIGKKTSLVAKNRLCGYCVDGGGNWRSIIPVHVLPIQSSPVQSYFIRCLNDHRIMFKSFACDWSNWSDEKRVKNSNILNRKFIFGQRKLQTHELHCQDETTAFFRVGERGKLDKFRRNMTRRMRHFQGNYRLLSCYWKKPLNPSKHLA